MREAGPSARPLHSIAEKRTMDDDDTPCSVHEADSVLWLAVENELLRRTSRNDRETITNLRAQLHTAKRALRTLHVQGAGSAMEHDKTEQQEHHHCLITQLCNLDRLALDWARRCEALEDEARELCQLRVEHAQVLEASQAMRAAHEATIHELQDELKRVHAQRRHAEVEAAELGTTKENLESQIAELSLSLSVSQRGDETLQKGMDAIEEQLQRMECGFASLSNILPLRLQKLVHDVAANRAAQVKEVEARKQRDVQVILVRLRYTFRISPSYFERPFSCDVALLCTWKLSLYVLKRVAGETFDEISPRLRGQKWALIKTARSSRRRARKF